MTEMNASMDTKDLALEDRTSLRRSSDNGTVADLYIDPAKEKKLLAKLDMAFTPIIMLVYLSCFLDRSNIGT